MKLFSRLLHSAIFISLITIFIQSSYAMEGLIVESLVEEGLDRGIAEGFAKAAQEEFGSLSAREFEAASETAQKALLQSVEDGLQNLKTEIEALKGATKLTEENLATIKSVFSEQKSAFSKDLEGIFKEKFSPTDEAIFKGKFVPESAFRGEPIPNVLAQGKVLSIEIKTLPEAEQLTSKSLISAETRDLASEELGNLRRTGASQEDISAAEIKLKQAEQATNVDRQQLESTAQKNVESAQTELKDAKIDDKPAKEQQVADAAKEDENAKRVSYSEEHENAKIDYTNAKANKNYAQRELDDANAELKAARKSGDQAKITEAEAKVKAKTADYEKATEDVAAAQKNLIEKENQLLEKSDIFKNKWDKTKVLGSKAQRSAAGSIKWGGTKLWNALTGALDQMLIAVWFTVPNMIIEAYNSAQAKKKLLETQKKYQQWGGIWLKIPDFFINENDPTNSLHIYVGVPNDGYPITDEFLKTANYFVVKSDYAPWGSSSIFDNVSAMVHLNTGYVFVSDGQPFDSNEPTMPFGEIAEGQPGLIGHLDDLSGKAAAGLKTEGVQYYVDSYEAGYQGNATVAKLFKSPTSNSSDKKTDQDGQTLALPPILMPTVNALQEGTHFGTDAAGKSLYLVQAFKGFNKSDHDNGKQIMEALIGAGSITDAPEAADDENYVLRGLYIYQTKDTPIVDLVKKQISPNNPQGELLRNAVADYVVMLDRDNNVVPLMTPQPMVLPSGSKESAFVHYALNPKIVTMKSLIDGSSKAYDAHGSSQEASFPEVSAPKSIPSNQFQKIIDQIKAMQTFFGAKIKYGPFTFGGTTLTIDKKLADANVFIYKAAGFLEGGFDDYLVALEIVKDEKTGKSGLAVSSLPSNGIALFVSLVTSRFYDQNLQPYTPPIAQERAYYITKDNTVSTGKPSDSSLPQATAPLYTLFVEGPYNPSPKPANFSGNLPVGPYWALDDSSMFSLQGVSPLSAALKQLNQTALIDTIKKIHASWVAVLDVSDPGALSKKMGPFDFVTSGVETVRLRAYNPSAIKLGYYVYTSGRYPDEFLVLSKNAEGTEGIGEEFNGQQYAISLSNGNVYDAQANGNAIKPINDPVGLMKNLGLTTAGVDARIANEQKILDAAKKSAKDSKKIASLDAQSAALASVKTAVYQVVSDIEKSQTAFNNKLNNQLYSDDLIFAGRQLYLPRESYLAGQYIYADVTGLGDPLDDKGNEIPSVVNQIKDYYVTYEEQIDEKTEEKMAIFGNPLSKNTLQIISLVSGGAFDRGGSYVTSYQTIKIGNTSFDDLNNFVNRIFDIIKARMSVEKRPETIVLQPKIQPLLDAAYNAIKKELKNIADAKKDSLAEYPSKASLAQNLFGKKSNDEEMMPYIAQSPALLPRYLKTVGNKYFMVTPPAPIELNEQDAADYDAKRTFIDYDINEQDHNGPNAKGMVYDRNGKPLQLITGWQLMTMRAFAGIIIDGQGTQTLGIGVDHPALPLTVTVNGKPEPVMIDTQLNIPNDGLASFKIFYNTQIDSYLIQIKTQQSNYFIDLASGYGYNLDGTPRYNEAPVFVDDKGEVLLVGTDSYGLKKVAFKKQGATKYLIYNQMVSFGALNTYASVDLDGKVSTIPLKGSGSVQFPEYGGAQGSYFTLLSDSFGDPLSAPSMLENDTPSLQELRLAYAFLDKTSNTLTSPFYVVWDQVQSLNPGGADDTPDNPKYLLKNTLVGKFTPDPSLKFSLLNYMQTRYTQTRTSLAGTYRPEDFYNYPRGSCKPEDTSCVKTPKVVGLIYQVENGKQTMKEIFYQNQRCALTLLGPNSYRASYKDENGASKQIYVKFETTQQKDSPLIAHWISITDGAKILDYAQESLIWDTLPLPPDVTDVTSLDYRKRNTWKLNVTNFVTNAGFTKDFPGTHLNAVATNLNANKSIQSSDLKGCAVAGSIAEEIKLGLASVKLDDAGQLYLPHAPLANKETTVAKRFIYKFGSNGLEKNLSFYDPALNGWSVDLNNGILYEPSLPRLGAYPTGIALQPAALAELLGFLQLYIDRDERGNPQGLGIVQCTVAQSNAPQKTTMATMKAARKR